jgi:hypothetical protein
MNDALGRRALSFVLLALGLAQDARQIVAESENRSRSKSQQYEGTLEVIGASNKVSIKRWEYRRIGSYGAAKRSCVSPRRPR